MTRRHGLALVAALLCSAAGPCAAQGAPPTTPAPSTGGPEDAALAPSPPPPQPLPETPPPTSPPPSTETPRPSPEPAPAAVQDQNLHPAGASNSAAPRDAGPEAQLGFHWVFGNECPGGEVPARDHDAVVTDGRGDIGCVPRGRADFVKSELTNLGSSKLVLKDSRISVAAGTEIYGTNILSSLISGGVYLHIQPEVDLRFGRFSVGVNVPLNFLVYPGGISDGKFVLRKEDWETPNSYARVLSYLVFGKKEDHFYLNISQLFASSIGDGAIMRRYFANTVVNDTHVGAEVDAYGRYAGAQVFTRDILPLKQVYSGQNADLTFADGAPSSTTVKAPLVAAMAFVRPFAFADNLLLRYLSLAFTYAADFDAPYQIGSEMGSSSTGRPVLQPNGLLWARNATAAQVMGADLEAKIYRSARADLKPFLDYSGIVGAGSGATLGMLGRFSLGGEKTHALRAMVALRTFDGQYLPSYFDTQYEVQKYQFINGVIDPKSPPPTKLYFVQNGDPGAWFFGYSAELSYSYDGGFAFTVAYDDGYAIANGHPDTLACQLCGSSKNTPQALRSLTLHIEYPVYSWFQFFVTASKRGFDWDQFFQRADDLIVYAQIRLHILPVLFLNAGAFQTYVVDPGTHVFENTFGFNFSIEVGYEFDRFGKKK